MEDPGQPFDHKLGEACQFAILQSLPVKLESVELQKPMVSFERNVSRIAEMVQLLPRTVAAAMYQQKAWDRACFEQFGTLDPENPAESDLLIVHYKASHHGQPPSHSRVAQAMAAGDRLLPSLLAKEPPEVHRGVQSLLAAQVIGAWTAFEAFLEDLWVAAVDARPTAIGKHALMLRSKSKDAKMVLPFDLLDKYDWNLKACIGTMLAEEDGPLRFDRHSTAARVYEETFGRAAGAADRDRLSKLLWLWEIRLLEALRNVFAHSGGIADEKFRSKINGIPDARWSGITRGDEVRLVGSEASELCGVMIGVAHSIAKIADAILTTNPR